jgi:nitroreductase
MTRPFDYHEAFSRNLGWVRDSEQEALRGKHVAIAGMGGVGGVHLLTLARLGIGAFTIADFDRFDLANFNRQVGAMMSTLDQPKIEVLARMARDINPELRITSFPQGVQDNDIDSFLEGADLFVDGLDFFVIPIRRRIFARCRELGIPAITAAPIGMGTAWLAFEPHGMSFEEYFRFEGQPEEEQFLRFFMGLTPKALQREYLVDPTRLDLPARRGPSTTIGCQLASGVAAATSVKLLLGRGDVKAAPYHHHFDPFVCRYAISHLPNGNAGRVQAMRMRLVRRAFAAAALRPKPVREELDPADTLGRILSAGRWAPSGDNDQPWTFERVDDSTAIIHVRPRDPANVYEYRDGEPLLLAAGMLLASLEIAASASGRRMEWTHAQNSTSHTITVRFPADPAVVFDKLYGVLTLRTVDRRKYATRPLTLHEKQLLEASLQGALKLRLLETATERKAVAALGRSATDIRLRAKETFETHRSVIDWVRKLSPSGIPATALGISRTMQRMMRWQMAKWSRTNTANRLFGTFAAALQLDLAPGAASAAFFVLDAPDWEKASSETVLSAGRAIQRFWLTATQLGLSIQPALATTIFADHGAKGTRFTAQPDLLKKAKTLSQQFKATLGIAPQDCAFIGRIGQTLGQLPQSRSVRRPLSELMVPRTASAPDPGEPQIPAR